VTAWSAVALLWACTAAMGATPVYPLSLEEDWTTQSQGPWRARYDHRELLVMRHPWSPSTKGDFVSVTREVTAPEDWQGPISLTFYCSDDYHTDTWRPDGSWLTAEGFIGHRCKQVLVGDHVVWSADVADPVVKGESPRYRVELSVKPGQKFLLTLLAYDAEASSLVLEKDFYQSPNNERRREDDPNASNFQTHIYWGDLALVDGNAEASPGKRPSEFKLRAVHNQRWPLPPFGDGWDKGSAPLTLCAPAGIPKRGFPVRCGVPVPAGKLKDSGDIRLVTPGKRAVYAQKSVLGAWPDESVQWVLMDLLAVPGMDKLDLVFAHDRAEPIGKIQVEEDGAAAKVNAGPLRFEVRAGDPIWNVTLGNTPKIGAVSLNIKANGDEVPGNTETCDAIDEGPFCATMRLRGRFDAADRSLGSFTLYCSAYAGLPYLKLVLRWFNDTKADLAVSALRVVFTLPEQPGDLRIPEFSVKDGAVVKQTSERQRLLDGTPVDPAGPMFLAWKGGAVTVRNFRELYPKSVQVDGNKLIFGLVAAEERPIVFTPGEAKTHELWVSLDENDPAQFAATVARPPILQNPEYFCATGVLGPARPHDGVPVLHEHMTQDFTDKKWEDFGQSFGVRDFPDSPYYGGLPNWSNNYYERMLNLFSEWFMSGDRAWYDRAVDVCRHIMDVAVIHSEVPGKDWLGAMHGPGKDHVSGPWNPTLRTAGLALYHKLTGDIEACDAVVGVAEFCVRTHAGIDGGSVRQEAGPFDAVCTAYAETGDVKFLDDGAARVESVLRSMDMRRGVWPDEHGSKVYRGNVPWMAAQMARPLYLWYHATGDVQAAQALVGLAESIICENTDWDQPGVVSGYSHNPHFDVSASYDLLILPMIFAAYELTEDTFFLDAAKAQWERWRREKAFDSPLNCHWNTPWLVWYLKKYDVVTPESVPEKIGE